jgi:preprotein translocase subunit YajC
MTSLLAQIAILAQDAAAASAAAPAGAPAQPPAWQTPLIMVLFAASFYFLLIRPQQKKAKETAQKQSSLKTGDKVATSAGIIGKVVSIDDKSVTLQVSEGVRIPFQRSAIVEFLADDTAKA